MVSTKSVLKVTVLVIQWLIITGGLGVYLGVRNLDDRVQNVISNPNLSDEVTVYRDNLGMPTIIGKTIEDVLFVQAYEYARDRLFQLEFTRAVVNGELSQMLGDELYTSDVFLRTIGIKRSATEVVKNLDPLILKYLNSYIKGLNSYINDHPDNIPLEFILIQSKPKPWTVEDIVGVQGMMSFDLAFRGLKQELDRLKFYQTAGMERMLQILDIQNPNVVSYLQTYNESVEGLSTSFNIPVYRILKENGIEFGTGSNNWVVSGKMTRSGKPLIANDPHLSLSTPGIWWKVHLIATEDNLNVEGFSLPGIPFVIVGHNQDVAWGVTNTALDAVDLFYFKRNETHYLVGNEWREIEMVEEEITLKSGSVQTAEILMTDFGPLMDMGGTEYAVRWTLNEVYDRDNIVKSVFLLNTAETINDIHDALEFWVVPGQNFVMADVEGNIGYQFTGGIPIRKSGFGMLPHNASTGDFDWVGIVPYEDQLWLPNPDKGWFSSNNERIDKRNLFYIHEAYPPGYRARNIAKLLENATDLTVEDMQRFQMNTYISAYEDYLLPVLQDIIEGDYREFTDTYYMDALDEIQAFDGYADRDSIGATIFLLYQLFFVDETIRDEVGKTNADNMNYYALKRIGEMVVNDSSNEWFDNKNTTITETAGDVAVSAFKRTILYLSGLLGKDVSKWQWGNIHKVTFEHKFHKKLPALSTGSIASDGANFALNNGGAPNWNSGAPVSSQNFGASMRFVAEVDSGWDSTFGVVPVGESGNKFSPNYDDQFDAWLEGYYFKWEFDAEYARANSVWSAKFVGGV